MQNLRPRTLKPNQKRNPWTYCTKIKKSMNGWTYTGALMRRMWYRASRLIFYHLYSGTSRKCTIHCSGLHIAEARKSPKIDRIPMTLKHLNQQFRNNAPLAIAEIFAGETVFPKPLNPKPFLAPLKGVLCSNCRAQAHLSRCMDPQVYIYNAKNPKQS